MNAIPPAADLSKLKGILGNAKAIMNKVNNNDFETGNVDSTSLVQDTSNYVNEGAAPQHAVQAAQSMGDPARKMGQISESAIANSNMPEAIKKAMLENPIQQPTMNHSFSLDDVADLIDEKPMPAPSTPRTQPRKQMNESIVQQTNDTFTVSESALRGIIKDVLIEYLSVDYSKNLTEGVIKKTINTLIKEGKIKTKK
jgi:hypothetical protein